VCDGDSAARETVGGSRYIPASVRRTVWRRDDGRCAFVWRDGRCTERSFLEYHHVQPYAAGGAAATANIELRCRAHNAYEASLFFGDGCDRTMEHPVT
jgi:5-methylcytosine-specific restriction endonuclease McrA